jgi:hypothetical protein
MKGQEHYFNILKVRGVILQKFYETGDMIYMRSTEMSDNVSELSKKIEQFYKTRQNNENLYLNKQEMELYKEYFLNQYPEVKLLDAKEILRRMEE